MFGQGLESEGDTHIRVEPESAVGPGTGGRGTGVCAVIIRE
jgi:hypothetical protein